MKRLVSTLIAAGIAASAVASVPAQADPDGGYRGRGNAYGHDQRGPGDGRGHYDARRGHGYGRDWHRGDRIARDDWYRYPRVDYRAYRLRPPPRGYEWRRVDGNYVLAAVATGLIMDIILQHR